MDDQFADILEQCLNRIEHGATVDECLAAHPRWHADLELPLRAAAQLHALPRPLMPRATRATLEMTMLQLAAERRAAQPPSVLGNSKAQPIPMPPGQRRVGYLTGLTRLLRIRPQRGHWLQLTAVAATLVLALVLSAGARAMISIISPQPSSLPALTPTGAPLMFDGLIEHISQERWVIGGRVILLDAQTIIRGRPMPGMTARVYGTLFVDGVMQADSIIVEAAQATPTPSVVPSTPVKPTAIPTTTPTTIPTTTPTPSAIQTTTIAPPTSTQMPTALPPASAVPDAVLTPAPAPAQPQATAPLVEPNENKGGDHPCQGQQLGRDENKCEPKPHDDTPDKPDQPDNPGKPDTKPDKPGKPNDKGSRG